MLQLYVAAFVAVRIGKIFQAQLSSSLMSGQDRPAAGVARRCLTSRGQLFYSFVARICMDRGDPRPGLSGPGGRGRRVKYIEELLTICSQKILDLFTNSPGHEFTRASILPRNKWQKEKDDYSSSLILNIILISFNRLLCICIKSEYSSTQWLIWQGTQQSQK